MNTAQAFHITEEEALETEALRELNAFLARPNSIGLDNLKESLRNMVQLMMEIKGYSTGYAVHHLVYGEHSSLALAGNLKGDEEKRRKIEELEQLMREMNRAMFMEFQRLFTHVQTRINVITENIENRINKLDETIEDAIEDDLDESVIQTKKKKRSRLKKFLQRVKAREQQLSQVETTEEVIEVEASLTRDINDLRNGEPEPQPIRESAFAVITGMLKNLRHNKTAEDEYTNTPEPKYTAWKKPVTETRRSRKRSAWDETGDSSSGTGEDTSGNSESGDDSSGEKEKDDNIEPPHTPDF